MIDQQAGADPGHAQDKQEIIDEVEVEVQLLVQVGRDHPPTLLQKS